MERRGWVTTSSSLGEKKKERIRKNEKLTTVLYALVVGRFVCEKRKREKKRERERECVCVRERERERERDGATTDMSMS